MKKSFLIVAAVAILIPTASWAKKSIGLSLKTGINLANISTDPKTEPDPSIKTGATIGAGLTVPLSDMFGIRAELLFSQKGFRLVQETSWFGKIDISTSINYLDIPITAVLMLPSRSVQPLFFVGPVIGIRIGDPTLNGKTLKPDEHNVASTDLGLALGAGINFPLGKNSAGIESRYTLGLVNVNDGNKGIIKNNVISIMLNYTFHLSK